MDYLTTYNYLSANRPNQTDLVVGKVERSYDNLQREISHKVYSSDDGTTYPETTTAIVHFPPVNNNFAFHTEH